MKRRELLKATLGPGLAAVGLSLAAGCGEKTPPPKTDTKTAGEKNPEEKKGTASLPEATLKNLKTAFNTESNCKARYEAFALKADEEGYQQVASLFRAVAVSEGIHAADYEKLLTSIGETAQAELQTVEVKTTRENLTAALETIAPANQKAYPEYVTQAKADKADGAERLFAHSKVVEPEFVKLFQKALEELETWKEGQKEFLVCERCGYTTLWAELEKCPICSEPKKGLRKVS